MLNSTPDCTVSTTVPLVTAQVGCVTCEMLGAEGMLGTGFIVTAGVPIEVQEVSLKKRTRMVYVPGAKPLNTGEV
jgi:hypothetical protein